jgi:hypothetical protein
MNMKGSDHVSMRSRRARTSRGDGRAAAVPAGECAAVMLTDYPPGRSII